MIRAGVAGFKELPALPLVRVETVEPATAFRAGNVPVVVVVRGPANIVNNCF